MIITYMLIVFFIFLILILSPSFEKTSEGDILLFYNDMDTKQVKRNYIKIW